MEEEKVGTITRFFPEPMAAAVCIEEGLLGKGDAIHVRGHVTDLYLRIESMEIAGREVERAGPGDHVGIHVGSRVRERDRVYRVREE